MLISYLEETNTPFDMEIRYDCGSEICELGIHKAVFQFRDGVPSVDIEQTNIMNLKQTKQ